MKKINKNLLFGAGFFILLIILISASALLTPYGVTEININDKLSAPSVHHSFGTDKFGRDIFTRIMAGGKIAFL